MKHIAVAHGGTVWCRGLPVDSPPASYYRGHHQDSTVSQKLKYDEIRELVSRFVRYAGYADPTPLQSAVVPIVLQGKDLLTESKHGDGISGAMLVPLLIALENDDEPAPKAIILAESSEQVDKICHQYGRFTAEPGRYPSLAAIRRGESFREELQLTRKTPDILLGTSDRLIDCLRRDSISLSSVRYVVLDVPERPGDSGYAKDLLYIYAKLRGKQQTIAFLRDLNEISAFNTIFRRPYRLYRSEWENGAGNGLKTEEVDMSDKERFESAISALVKRVKESENAEVLNHYRKIFRSSVPIHLRGYVAAILLKDYLGVEEILSETAKTLFVSVGKNRKVYPKDLSGLFAGALGIDQSTITGIKVLDNYSFVDLPESCVDRAVELLNDTEFRGRSITVSIARKRRR